MATLIRDPYDRLRALAAGEDPNTLPLDNAPPTPAPVLDTGSLRRAEEVASFEGLSDSERALRQGSAGVTSALQSVRGLARIGLGDEAAGLQDLTDAQRRQNTAAEFGPRVQSLDQVNGVGDALEWARNQALQQIPNIALSAGSGGIGGGARVVAGSLARQGAERVLAGAVARRVAAGAAEGAAERVAGTAAARSIAQGTALGGGAAGVALEAGQIAPDTVLDPEGTGSVRERAGKAAVGALAAGSIEALPVMSLFRKYGLGGAEEAVTGGVLARVAKQGVKQGLEEASTEVAQTAAERLAHKWVNDNVQVLGPDAYSDYLNSAAGGFLGGAVFGAPSGLRGAGDTSPAYSKLRDRVAAVVDKITPDFGKPGQPIGETGGEPVGPAPNLGEVGARAAQQVQDLAGRSAEGLKQATDKVAEYFNKNFGQATRESSIDDTVNEIFHEVQSAQPLDYSAENGTAVFNRPFNKFADSQRARQSVAAGVPVDIAVVASTVPADREVALSRSGALQAAAQALRGDSLENIDGAKLREYTDVLSPEARRMFIRTTATMQELAANDFIQRDETGRAQNAQIATPPAATDVDAAAAATSDFDTKQNTTEPVALRDPGATYKALRGIPLKAAQTELPPNSYSITDSSGRQRYGDVRVLGSQVAQIKADQDFQDSTRTMNSRQRNVAALAQAAADVAQAGGKLDLSSLKTGMKLGKDWTLVPADIAAIRAAAEADAARSQRAPTQGPVDRATAAQREVNAEQRSRDLAMDPGAIDPSEIEQVAGGEGAQPDAEQRVLAPRGGRPAELRVSDSGRVTEAQTIDSGEIDREARRQENTAQWGTPEKVARVDEGLKRVLGRAPADSQERGQMVREARSKLTGDQLNRFNERVYDASNSRVAPLRAAYEQATSDWRELRAQYAAAQQRGASVRELQDLETKGRAARDAMAAAQTKLNNAQARANADRKLVRRQPSQPKLAPKTTDATKIVGAKAPTRTEESSAVSAETYAEVAKQYKPETIKGQVPKTRSRRELDALAQRVVHAKGMTEARRIELLEEIVKRREDLVAETVRAGGRDNIENRVFSQTPEHFTAAAKALANKDKLTDALTALRPVANAQQRKLIDTLVKMGSLRDVKFDTRPMMTNGQLRPPVRDGLARGLHFASPQRRALDSVVAINVAARPAAGNTNVDVVSVVLHEAMHAATSHAELTNTQSRNAIKQMLEHARVEAGRMGMDADSWYGLSETQEFIAEAFTNPEFQRMLEQMQPAGTTEFKNLWEQFKNFVAKLLGLSKDQASLLDEVFTVGLDMARQTADARNDAFMSIYGLSSVTEEASNFGVNTAPTSGAQPTDYMSMLPPRERLYLMDAFSRGPVLEQIRKALAPNLQVVLNTADEGPSLTVNTGLALAMNGQLDLEKGAAQAVAQLSDTVRNVLQIPSSRTYARQIVADLKAGKVNPTTYSAQAQALNPTALKVTRFIENNVIPATQAFATDMDQRLRTTGVPALTQLATLLSQRTGEFRSDRSASFNARVNKERGQRLNDFYKIIEGWDDDKKAQITRALQQMQTQAFVQRRANGNVTTEDVSGDAKKVLDFFKDQYDYLTGAGLKLGKTPVYFPVTIDGEAIANNKADFISLLNEPNLKKIVDKMGGAEALYKRAINSTGRGEQLVGNVSFADGQHDPSFKPLNRRLSAFIYSNGTPAQIEKFSKFQDPTLERIAVNYINRSVRRAEWNRLGLGERIPELLSKAKTEGASDKQLTLARDYIDQTMGTYGQDWHPMIKRALEGVDNVLGTSIADTDFKKVKGLQSALITYQNVRLLPLALMSSFIDPLGSSMRAGGELKAHFASMKEALSAIRNKGGTNALRAMAEDMGIVERHAVNEALVYLYSGAHDPSGRLAKINNALFKYNGLELTTKYSRLTALALGHKFLLKHAADGSKSSARYLQELGLTKDQIKDDGTGHVVRNAAVDEALSRFVDESVVRPSPGQRPGWHNDPHFALAAQYKGYLYSFWNTVMRRAGVELKNGNYAVLAPMMLYLPVTGFGEMLRDMFQDDDDDRDMVDYAKLSVERSGLLGPKINLLQSAQQDTQFGSSALNSLAGPTGQQLGDMYDVFSGRRSASTTAVEALPGSALYEDWHL